MVESVKRDHPDVVVTKVQGQESCEAPEGFVGQLVGVEGVGHLQVEEGLANLSEGHVLYPDYLVAGQVQPRDAGNVVKSVTSDNFYIGINKIEDFQSGRKILKLAWSEVAVVSGGSNGNFPERSHDSHLSHWNVSHVISLQVQVLHSVPGKVEYFINEIKFHSS